MQAVICKYNAYNNSAACPVPKTASKWLITLPFETLQRLLYCIPAAVVKCFTQNRLSSHKDTWSVQQSEKNTSTQDKLYTKDVKSAANKKRFL